MKNINTKLIHTARGEMGDARPVNPPIMPASTILFKDHETWQDYREKRKTERVLSYGARGTKSNFELEKMVCELEGGYRANTFPTGLAALTCVLLNFAESGAHFIITDGIYGPVRAVAANFLAKIGVEVDFINSYAEGIEELIKPNTKLILCESPSSILYEVIDLPALAKIAKKHNIVLAIDSTYSSSYLSHPLQLGANIAIIASTKYLGGHSDVTQGIVVSDKQTWEKFDVLPEVFGYSSSAFDCYLVLRGIRTLGVRLKAHEESTDKVVDFLKKRNEIVKIYYPKLKEHKNHDIFMRDFKGANGMLTVEFDKKISKEKIIKFVDSLKFFSIGASWGGFESLATITVPPRTHENFEDRGVLVRFHIGLEDSEDLINDLANALSEIGA